MGSRVDIFHRKHLTAVMGSTCHSESLSIEDKPCSEDDYDITTLNFQRHIKRVYQYLDK